MKESLPAQNFESTPDIRSKTGRENLLIDVITIYHEATQIREEAGFDRVNLSNEELPGFAALHFTYGRLKKLLTELAQKAERNEDITEEEQTAAEKLDKSLQTYFDQLQNSETETDLDLKEVVEKANQTEFVYKADESLYERETAIRQNYEQELDRLRTLTTNKFLQSNPAYSQFSRNLQKYNWLLETIENDSSHSVTRLVLQNTKERLETSYQELKKAIENRRQAFEAVVGAEMAELADSLSDEESTETQTVQEKQGWWNNSDNKILDKNTKSDLAEDSQEDSTDLEIEQPVTSTPDEPTEQESSPEQNIEKNTNLTILGLQIPQPGTAGSGAAFVFREEVLHTLALAQLPAGNKNQEKNAKRLDAKQKQQLAEVRNIVHQISPYSGLSNTQYEKLSSLAENTDIANSVIGNPRLEKGLLGRTSHSISEKAKSVLQAKLPTWKNKAKVKNKKVASKLSILGGAVGAGLVAYYLYPTDTEEISKNNPNLQSEEVAKEASPDTSTTTSTLDSVTFSSNEYPDNLPVQNKQYKIPHQKVSNPFATPPNEPEGKPAYQSETFAPTADTVAETRSDTPASDSSPEINDSDNRPKYETRPENLSNPITENTYSEQEYNQNLETDPHLPKYEIQKDDTLWEIALGKVEGTEILPALKNLSADEQKELLYKLRQQLIKDEKTRAKIGIKFHPDYIYYSDTSLPLPDGDILSLHYINNTLEELKDNK